MKTGDNLSLQEYRDTLPKFSQRSKYGNKRTTVDGIKFDSKKEADRYGSLKLLERHGAISNLELQPEYHFRHKGKLLMTYRPDFRYVEDGALVIEDVKSEGTRGNRVYAIKKKAMLIWFDIQILET